MDLGQLQEEPSSAPPPRQGFFQKLIALFTSSSDPEAEKKRLLKQVAKDVVKSGFRFYKPKEDLALTGLAKFFYDIYKVVAPAQVLLQNAESSGTLKSFIIDSFLSEEQVELSERLSEDSILKMTSAMGLKQVQEEVKNCLVQYYAAFDSEKIRQIDMSYNVLLSFIRFTSFDYYFLLKKFDSALTERSFSYNPRFEAINGAYVAEDLKDFLEVFNGLNLDGDWRRIFAGLKEYKNLDVINVTDWEKLSAILKSVRQSRVLPSIVMLLDKNPFYKPITLVSNEKVVDPYLQKVKTNTEMVLQKVIQERRNSKVEELAKLIFGTSAVSRMKNYAEKANAVFSKKMLGGYIYVQPLSYLKAFLLDFFKKDIRELNDILLIRGKWTTNLSSQGLSESFHALMSASDNLIRFDDSLADDGDTGSRMRMVIAKSDRDKEQLKYLRQMLKDLNTQALSIINQSAASMIAMGRTFKILIEDCEKSHHECLINWKEVDIAADGKIKARMTDAYKKIYYFVQLMQYYVREEAV